LHPHKKNSNNNDNFKKNDKFDHKCGSRKQSNKYVIINLKVIKEITIHVKRIQ